MIRISGSKPDRRWSGCRADRPIQGATGRHSPPPASARVGKALASTG